jgi:hypothetical protein
MLKKFEIIFAVILIIAFFMKSAHIPGGAALFIVSGSSLSLLYNIFSFFLLNDIKLRNIARKSAYQHTSISTIVLAIFIGFAISTVFVGVVFRTMLWPGGEAMLNAGLITLAICTLITLFIQPKVIQSKISMVMK